MTSIAVSRVRPHEQEALAAMLHDYLRELGAATDYPWLAAYGAEASRHPYLLREGDAVVGFALVRQRGDGRCEMAEFGVLPAHRRRGVGSEAVRAVLACHPGPWEVRSFPGDARAGAFWQRVLPVRPVRDGGQDVYVFDGATG
jgi:predicted acetyltransferase